MKLFKKILLFIILGLMLAYVTNITAMPDSLILFEGEKLNLGQTFGLYINEETVQTAKTLNNENIIEKKAVTLSLFNVVDVKEIEVTTIPKTTVVPLGNIVGLKLYSSGVLVIGMTEVGGQKPYEKSNIEEGDLIVSVDSKEVKTTEELIECVNSSNGEILSITYIRDGEECTTEMEPVKTGNNEYKLGLWVRDGAAGIGTITYYEPDTGSFAALGHGIQDADSGKLISIDTGEIVSAKIYSIIKGASGSPRRNKGNNS